MTSPFRNRTVADRRLLVVLRVPAQELACSLPGEIEPSARCGQGVVLLDYAFRSPGHGPVALRGGVHHLAMRIPVRRSSSGETALHVPRRWCSSRVATSVLARRGSGTRAEPAQFDLRVEGFGVELEVRNERGRVLYLRAEAAGELEGSVFRRPEEVETSLREWSRGYRGGSLCAGLDRPTVPEQGVAFHPMVVHAMQTSTLPELFPGVEEAVELDCVLRQVRHRLVTQRPMSRTVLGQLTRGRSDLDAPPAGAFMVAADAARVWGRGRGSAPSAPRTTRETRRERQKDTKSTKAPLRGAGTQGPAGRDALRGSLRSFRVVRREAAPSVLRRSSCFDSCGSRGR
ncbi:MAG: hypothetical protein R3F34_06300 [Planctomycetota bacterium]